MTVTVCLLWRLGTQRWTPRCIAHRRPANERLTGFLRAGYKSRNTRLMPIPTRLILFLTLLALLSGCVSSSGTRSKSGSDGVKPLFDGKTFNGWRGYRMKAMPAKGWRIEDGILKKVGGERGGDIITDETFDNFDLSWEWRISPKGNNGIKYLVTEDRPSAPGYEYQMIDDKANEDGKLGPKHATASFYDVLQIGRASCRERVENLVRDGSIRRETAA